MAATLDLNEFERRNLGPNKGEAWSLAFGLCRNLQGYGGKTIRGIAF